MLELASSEAAVLAILDATFGRLDALTIIWAIEDAHTRRTAMWAAELTELTR
jgi:hypothetical protein